MTSSTDAGQLDVEHPALVGGDDRLLVLEQEVGASPTISGATSSWS
jgi:hypothetical protein